MAIRPSEITTKEKIDAELELLVSRRNTRDRNMKVIYWILGVSAIFHLVTLLLVYAPVNVISYQNVPFPTGKTWYFPGDRISYTVKYCKNSDTPGTISRSLVYSSGKSIATQQVSTTAPVGCRTNEVLSFVVPSDAPPGKAHVENTSVYDGFFFRKQVIRTQTMDFTIKEKKQAPL